MCNGGSIIQRCVGRGPNYSRDLATQPEGDYRPAPGDPEKKGDP